MFSSAWSPPTNKNSNEEIKDVSNLVSKGLRLPAKGILNHGIIKESCDYNGSPFKGKVAASLFDNPSMSKDTYEYLNSNNGALSFKEYQSCNSIISKSEELYTELQDFVYEKGSRIFKTNARHIDKTYSNFNWKCFASLDKYKYVPPLEYFLNVGPELCEKQFLKSVCAGDILFGKVIEYQENDTHILQIIATGGYHHRNLIGTNLKAELRWIDLMLQDQKASLSDNLNAKRKMYDIKTLLTVEVLHTSNIVDGKINPGEMLCVGTKGVILQKLYYDIVDKKTFQPNKFVLGKMDIVNNSNTVPLILKSIERKEVHSYNQCLMELKFNSHSKSKHFKICKCLNFQGDFRHSLMNSIHNSSFSWYEPESLRDAQNRMWAEEAFNKQWLRENDDEFKSVVESLKDESTSVTDLNTENSYMKFIADNIFNHAKYQNKLDQYNNALSGLDLYSNYDEMKNSVSFEIILQYARERESTKNFREAEKLYKKCLEFNPENKEAKESIDRLEQLNSVEGNDQNIEEVEKLLNYRADINSFDKYTNTVLKKESIVTLKSSLAPSIKDCQQTIAASGSAAMEHSERNGGNIIYIKSKFENVTEDDLRKCFSQFGKIVACSFRICKRARDSFFMAEFENSDAAHNAAKQSQLLHIKGNKLNVRTKVLIKDKGGLGLRINPINPAETVCRFETQPGGCQKKSCNFKHSYDQNRESINEKDEQNVCDSSFGIRPSQQGIKLFVRSKSLENVTEKDLRKNFSQFGKVGYINIPKLPDGSNRNFCFVVVKNEEAADMAVKQTSILSIKGNVLIIEKKTTVNDIAPGTVSCWHFNNSADGCTYSAAHCKRLHNCSRCRQSDHPRLKCPLLKGSDIAKERITTEDEQETSPVILTDKAITTSEVQITSSLENPQAQDNYNSSASAKQTGLEESQRESKKDSLQILLQMIKGGNIDFVEWVNSSDPNNPEFVCDIDIGRQKYRGVGKSTTEAKLEAAGVAVQALRESTKIFVKTISFAKTTEEDIKDFFSKFGKVVAVNLNKKKNGKVGNFCFVDFENNFEANEVADRPEKLYIKGNLLKITKMNEHFGSKVGYEHGSNALPLPPRGKLSVADTAPLAPLGKFSGANTAPLAPRRKFSGANTAPLAPWEKNSGANAAPLISQGKFSGANTAPLISQGKFSGANTAPLAPRGKLSGASTAQLSPQGKFSGANSSPDYMGYGRRGIIESNTFKSQHIGQSLSKESMSEPVQSGGIKQDHSTDISHSLNISSEKMDEIKNLLSSMCGEERKKWEKRFNDHVAKMDLEVEKVFANDKPSTGSIDNRFDVHVKKMDQEIEKAFANDKPSSGSHRYNINTNTDLEENRKRKIINEEQEEIDMEYFIGKKSFDRPESRSSSSTRDLGTSYGSKKQKLLLEDDDVSDKSKYNLLVRGLSIDRTEEEVKQFFSTYGVINEVLLEWSENPTFMGEQTAYVEFQRTDDVILILNQSQSLYIKDSLIGIQMYVDPSKSNNAVIFVSGFSHVDSNTKGDLIDYFNKFGLVKTLFFNTNSRNNHYAFVAFQSNETVKKIISNNEPYIFHRAILKLEEVKILQEVKDLEKLDMTQQSVSVPANKFSPRIKQSVNILKEIMSETGATYEFALNHHTSINQTLTVHGTPEQIFSAKKLINENLKMQMSRKLKGKDAEKVPPKILIITEKIYEVIESICLKEVDLELDTCVRILENISLPKLYKYVSIILNKMINVRYVIFVFGIQDFTKNVHTSKGVFNVPIGEIVMMIELFLKQQQELSERLHNQFRGVQFLWTTPIPYCFENYNRQQMSIAKYESPCVIPSWCWKKIQGNFNKCLTNLRIKMLETDPHYTIDFLKLFINSKSTNDGLRGEQTFLDGEVMSKNWFAKDCNMKLNAEGGRALRYCIRKAVQRQILWGSDNEGKSEWHNFVQEILYREQQDRDRYRRNLKLNPLPNIEEIIEIYGEPV